MEYTKSGNAKKVIDEGSVWKHELLQVQKIVATEKPNSTQEQHVALCAG